MTTTYNFYDNITGEKLETKRLESFDLAVKHAERLEFKFDTTVKFY